MFGSNCNITQTRLPSDVECHGEVVPCDDWPFRRGEGEDQGVFGPSFHKGFLLVSYGEESFTCFLSIHIWEPQTDWISEVGAPTDHL